MVRSLLNLFFPKDHQTADWPNGEIISGTIEPYWEQGMEGRIEFVFVPEHGREKINSGRGYFLTSGDYLRIYGQDGSVLWEGELRFVISRLNTIFFQDRHRLDNSIWAISKQEGVPYADWIGWFGSQPRLKAEYLKHT